MINYICDRCGKCDALLPMFEVTKDGTFFGKVHLCKECEEDLRNMLHGQDHLVRMIVTKNQTMKEE